MMEVTVIPVMSAVSAGTVMLIAGVILAAAALILTLVTLLTGPASKRKLEAYLREWY